MIVTAVVILLAALILWGMGRMTLRYCGITENINLLAIGIGLSVVITIGGLLNALQLAYAPALWGMIALGSAITVLEFRHIDFDTARLRSMPILVYAAILLITAAVLFTIVTQAPPSIFNHYDDLQRYFAHPVRMLATGTLSGSPLNGMGHNTLGGQALLQAFVISLLPINFIATADSVFSLAVLLGLGAAIGWRLAPDSFAVFAIPLTILVIEPQIINISSVYLPCILMLSAFLLVTEYESRAGPILLGAVYTCLVSLKMTFALFTVVHFSLALIAVFVATRSWQQLTSWGLRVAAGSFGAFLPWLITYRQEYMQWGMNREVVTMSGADKIPNILSAEPLFYGASYAAYTLIATVCALFAILSLRKALIQSDKNQNMLLGVFSAAASGTVCYLILIFFIGSLVLGQQSSLRYSIPMLIAALVPALAVIPLVFVKLSRAAAMGFIWATCGAIVLLFGTSAQERYAQAWNYHNILAFKDTARNQRFQKLITSSLSDQKKAKLRRLQSKIPPSEPLLTKILTPFHLDYARNPIIDGNNIMAPWAHVPSNVHYVLWQYGGFGVRSLAESERLMARSELLVQKDEKTLREFTKKLNQAASDSRTKIIAKENFMDGSYVLFAIERWPE